MPFATVGPAYNRHRIFYRLYGSADAPVKLLLTMGLGGDHYQWEPQTEFFKNWEECQLCVYDNRGTGFSDPVAGRWTTRAMAQDALELLDSLGWNKPRSVHIVGLSMGGMITQELALLDTKRFGSMSLLSTIAGGFTSLGYFLLKLPTGIATMLGTFTTSDPNEMLKRGLQVLYPSEFLEQYSFNEKKGVKEKNFVSFRRSLVQRGRRAIQDGRKDLPFSTVLKQGVAVATHRLSSDDLGRLSAHFGPAVLVVTGDSDILVHPQNAEVLSEGMKGSTLLSLPIAGHGANEQCAAEVNDAIRKNVWRGTLRSRL